MDVIHFVARETRMTTDDVRTEMVSIRLTPDEHAKARAVAKYYGLNVAAWFRMTVAERAREIGVEPTGKKRAK